MDRRLPKVLWDHDRDTALDNHVKFVAVVSVTKNGRALRVVFVLHFLEDFLILLVREIHFIEICNF